MERLIARLTKGRSADLLDGETIEAAIVGIWSGYFSGLFAGLAIPWMVGTRSTVGLGVGVVVGGGGGVAIAVWQRRSQLKSAETSTLAGRFPVFAFLAVTSRGDLVVWRQTGGGKVGELTVRCRVTDVTSLATVRRLLFKRWEIGFIDGSDHVITRPGARDRTAFEEALARHGYTE